MDEMLPENFLIKGQSYYTSFHVSLAKSLTSFSKLPILRSARTFNTADSKVLANQMHSTVFQNIVTDFERFRLQSVGQFVSDIPFLPNSKNSPKECTMMELTSSAKGTGDN